MAAISDFRRSVTDSKVAGVCGGAAEHWKIDPTLVRVGAVVLALSSGIGLALYGAAWLLVPRSDQQLPLLKQKSAWARARSDETLWIIAVVVTVVLVGIFGSAFPMGLWPVFVIAAIWFFGLRDTGRNPQAAPPQEVSPTTAAFDEAATAWIGRVEDHRQASATAPPPEPVPLAAFGTPPANPPQTYGATQTHEFVTAAAPRPEPTGGQYQSLVRVTPAPVAEPRRWPGWRIGLFTAGLGLAVLASLAATGVAVPGPAFPAVALLGLAATLIASAWFARPRGMIAVAVILALATSLGSLIPRDIGEWNFTTAVHKYTLASELPARFDQDGGELTLDLTDLAVDESRTVFVDMRLGQMMVHVPADANVEIDWDLALGTAQLPTGKFDGSNISGKYTHQPDTDHPNSVLRLQVRIDLGDVTVTT